jgi:hypothetical protein
MDHRSTTLERAFELARSGTCADVGEVRRQLKAEGFSPEQLSGPHLIRQLRDLCVASTPASDGAP